MGFWYPPPDDPRPYRRPTEPEQRMEPETEEQIDVLLADPVVRWRAERFASLGFTPGQTRTLALAKHVAPYDVGRLLDRGCPHDIAFDIVS